MGGRNRGGQKRGRTQRKHFRDGRPDVWKKPRAAAEEDGDEKSQREPAWMPFVTESPAFEQFYKKQCIVPEQEWDDFLAILRKPLPAVFRINSSGQFAMEIRNQIEEEFSASLNCEVDGVREEPVKPLLWYPGKLAWHLSFSRMQLRKNQTLARLHEFLKLENEIGNITRQEAVSMVPPLFLDVQPKHRVLDMCAAPGSKTFQLLEMIHRDDKNGTLSNGLVVANDVDVQRCHLLIHQTKRMCSPNVIVTNHEAQHFPLLKKFKDNTFKHGDMPENDLHVPSKVDLESCLDLLNEENGLAFDRVLCDVPCSGDGTIRKAPDIWKKWNVGNANGLHRLQVQIAMRGVALLKVGGRLVYSTCSLNPVENEAVVGEVLRRSDGCLELLDVSRELPELKRRPGLRTWKVRDKGLWISSYQNVNKHRAGSVLPSMFPTGKGQEDQSNVEKYEQVSTGDLEEESPLENTEMGDDDDGEIATLPLERCVRILPHDQDTGAFFVAVFKKVAPLKAELSAGGPLQKHNAGRKQELVKDDGSMGKRTEVEVKGSNSIGQQLKDQLEEAIVSNSVETLESGVQDIQREWMGSGNEAGILHPESNERLRRIQQQGNWKGVDPVLFLKDEALISSIISFYGIKETFPLHGHLVTRSEDTSRLKRIYYISDSAANVLAMNFRAGEPMKITSLGLKIFERQGGKEGLSQCAFRIASEGLPLLLPHLTRQLVRASRPDFQKLLLLKTILFTAFSDTGFIAALQTLTPGCCVVILDDGQHDGQNEGTITAIGCWRGRTNMSLLIPKEEAAQLLHRLFSINKDDMPSLKTQTHAPAIAGSMEAVNNFTGMDDPYLDSTTTHEDTQANLAVAELLEESTFPEEPRQDMPTIAEELPGQDAIE